MNGPEVMEIVLGCWPRGGSYKGVRLAHGGSDTKGCTPFYFNSYSVKSSRPQVEFILAGSSKCNSLAKSKYSQQKYINVTPEL